MESSKRVLVLWADRRSANLGVRVLAEGSAELLRSVFGDDLHLTFQDFAGTETDVSMQKDGLLKDLGHANGAVKRLIREHDLVLDTGAGDSYTDIYGMGRFARMTRVQRLAQRFSVPVVMGPQTVGPFNNPTARHVAGRSLVQMTRVFARDPKSLDYVRAVAPRSASIASTDVVFALPLIEGARERDVILNVSGLLWQPNSHVDSLIYRASVRQLVRGLTEAGREVSILAHVIDNASVDNDVPAAEHVAREFDLELLIPDDLQTCRAHIAGSAAVIGSRMHACLNALSLGVPAYAWAYSRKFEPLFTSLGWSGVFDLRNPARTLVEDTLRAVSEPDMAALDALLTNARKLLDDTRQELRTAI